MTDKDKEDTTEEADTSVPEESEVEASADDAEQDESEESSEEVQNERRQEERTKIAVKRTILATVEDEAYGEMVNHLYLVDVAQAGMRINLDRNIEPESSIKIKFSLTSLGFGLEGDFESDCRVVWAKPTAGGTCIMGMEFKELAQEHSEALQQLIDHWAEKSGLELERLPSPVDVKIRDSEEDPWSRMYAIRAISTDGFQMKHHQDLEKGKEVYARILLEGGTVEAKASVRWCKPMPNGAFDVGCQFEGLSDGQKTYITLHLKRCRHLPIKNHYERS